MRFNGIANLTCLLYRKKDYDKEYVNSTENVFNRAVSQIQRQGTSILQHSRFLTFDSPVYF